MSERIGPHTLHHGDCLEVLRTLPDNSIDAVVTDPPYGLGKPPPIRKLIRAWLADEDHNHLAGSGGFMGREWDAMVPHPAIWSEACRVLKPGGHLIAFAGQRTMDLMGIGLRLGGFTLRDSGAWAFWSGFPKSLDISKAIDKRPGVIHQRDFARDLSSARKAAGLSRQELCEKVVGARTGAVWNWEHHQLPEARHRPALFDALPSLRSKWESILEEEDREVIGTRSYDGPFNGGQMFNSGSGDTAITAPATAAAKQWAGWGTALKPCLEPFWLARKPFTGTVAANVLQHGTGGLNIDACRYPYGDPAWPGPSDGSPVHDAEYIPNGANNVYGSNMGGGSWIDRGGRWPANIYYCPKASRAEREAGCEHLQASLGGSGALRDGGRSAAVCNHHPTVKPLALMRWLVRLVTPPSGVVLDPFAGSGTTLCAAALEGFTAHGCEREAEYLPIIRARLNHWRTLDPHEERPPSADPQVRLF